MFKVFESKFNHQAASVKECGEILWERKEEKPIVEIDGVEYSESTLRSLIKKATS